jgi:hypothetical protein
VSPLEKGGFWASPQKFCRLRLKIKKIKNKKAKANK